MKDEWSSENSEVSENICVQIKSLSFTVYGPWLIWLILASKIWHEWYFIDVESIFIIKIGSYCIRFCVRVT